LGLFIEWFGDFIRCERIVLKGLAVWSIATIGTSVSASRLAAGMDGGDDGDHGSPLRALGPGVDTGLHIARSRALAVHAKAQILGIMLGEWHGGWMADHIGAGARVS
jgi:hypothetical protein